MSNLIRIFSDGKFIDIDRDNILNDPDFDTATKVLVQQRTIRDFEKCIVDGKNHLRPYKPDEKEDCKKIALGEGTYGAVYSYDSYPIAVKTFRDYSNFLHINEIAAYRLLPHVGFPKLYDVKLENGMLNMYMQKLSSVDNLIESDYFAGSQKQVLYSIAKAIYESHSRGLIHLDLKYENCLYNNESKNVVVSDWGSCIFRPYTNGSKNIITTSTYRAPEIFETGRYDGSADIFSLGIMFYEIYKKATHTLNYPIDDNVEYKIERSIKRTKNIFDIRGLPNILHNLYGLVDYENTPMYIQTRFLSTLPDIDSKILVCQMTCSEPKARPTIAEVLNHPFFDDVRGDEKFDEITRDSILDTLKTVSGPIVVSDYNIKLRLFLQILIYYIHNKFTDITTFFLSMRLINVSGQKITNDARKTMTLGFACLIMAGVLCDKLIDISNILEYCRNRLNLLLTLEDISGVINNILQNSDINLFGKIPLITYQDIQGRDAINCLEEEIFYGTTKVDVRDNVDYKKIYDYIKYKLYVRDFKVIQVRDHSLDQNLYRRIYNVLYRRATGQSPNNRDFEDIDTISDIKEKLSNMV